MLGSECVEMRAIEFVHSVRFQFSVVHSDVSVLVSF